MGNQSLMSLGVICHDTLGDLNWELSREKSGIELNRSEITCVHLFKYLFSGLFDIFDI